jgi:UDPglucose--hexose-1-phosphate uridylyltransferase
VLFQDIIEAEQLDGARVLASNHSAIAFVPYFARYAYEVYVAPKRTCASVADLSDQEASDFSALLQAVLVMFDNLWHSSFPYTMMLHQLPQAAETCKPFHFHAQFHPPLRKPGLLKHLGGAETGGGNFHADTLPEQKAAELRRAAGIHYKHRVGPSQPSEMVAAR